jgi:hypothetical protein
LCDAYGFCYNKLWRLQEDVMKNLFLFICLAFMLCSVPALAQKKGGEVKSKFYDFSDQVIDGEIKKPTTLYTEARQKVKFERLLRLKKSFMDDMMQTAKEPVFK